MQPNKMSYVYTGRSAQRKSRMTATGLCDPIQSLAIDRVVDTLPHIPRNTHLVNSPQGSRIKDTQG